jgi:hypothetical protein
MTDIDKSRAETLANKLDSLNQYFDITESTISEISKHICVDDSEETELIEESEDDDTIQIIDLKTLKEDFRTIRSTLLETIKNGKIVIGSLTTSITELDTDNPDMIDAYASLVGTVNNSLKLLTGTYKDIITMQEILNKSKRAQTQKESKSNVSVGSVTVNSINASVSDIIKAMQSKGDIDVLEH